MNTSPEPGNPAAGENTPLISGRTIFLFVVLTGLSLGGYLLASLFTFRLGFPLDDAWIHMTYARNLGVSGEWSFLPGRSSAGSTSPLWSGLLSIGFALRLDPRVWAFLLGWLTLVGVVILGYVFLRSRFPGSHGLAIAGAIFLVLEWHLVWAAGSGMETLPFTLLVTVTLVWISSDWGHWFWLGLVIGLSVWLRPDGVTLLGPAGLVAWLATRKWKPRATNLAQIGIGFGLLFFPYLAFNTWLAGTWWPSTFYAKQAEYAVLQQVFFGKRLWTMAGASLVGVAAVLLPGIWFTFRGVWQKPRRNWGGLASLIWMAGFVGLYAWRLPVTYQHARYLIPVMPGLILFGFAGLMEWVRKPITRWTRIRWVIARVWMISAGFVLLIFWVLGARAYGRDVAVIESEMVTTARWINEHTSPGALIAAHDIGAIGYFSNRRLIDLAGLISPEVIPFIRDEDRLKTYLDSKGVGYLVTFEDWYPELEQDLTIVHSSQGKFSLLQGGNNMVVYLWGSK